MASRQVATNFPEQIKKVERRFETASRGHMKLYK